MTRAVFETIRVEGGRPLHLGDHLARLRASVKTLHGSAPGAELEACVEAALAGAGDEPQRLRVVAAPGAPPEAALAPLGVAASRAPVELRPWTLPGGLGAHKWLDRRLVDEAAARLGATPLIVEPGGEVLEAAWANVWALEGRRLLTPPADGRLLGGVTRARLLALAPALGLEAVEEPLSLDRLARADAILLTSALRLAVPGRLAGRPIRARDELVAEIARCIHEGQRADRGTGAGSPGLLAPVRLSFQSREGRNVVSQTAQSPADLDRQNGVTLGRILGRGNVGHAEDGPDGKMRATIRIPEDELVFDPGILILPHAGVVEIEFLNDDKNTHCAVLPSNGDYKFIWLVNHSRGTATLELDGPGYYWYGSRTGNDEGRGLTAAIVVTGDVPPEAKLDRPPQPQP